MKTKHTPGPWQYVTTTDGRHFVTRDEDGDRDTVIAEEFTLGGVNLPLLAAAPDMLAALEKIAWAPLGDPEASPADCLAAAEEIARAAIRRAKGEG